MARVDPIQDGQPITYELFNQLIDAVNNPKGNDKTQQDVEVYILKQLGPKIEKTAVIDAGTVSFTMPKNDTTKVVNIKYKSANFTEVPVVTATLLDTVKKGGGISLANITIIDVSKDSCDIKIKTLKSDDSETTLKINYIAIGAGSTN